MRFAIEEATDEMKKSGIHFLVVKATYPKSKLAFQNVVAGFPTKEAAENYVQEHHKVPRIRTEQ